MSNVIPRHVRTWVPGNHEGLHNDCECDMRVEFPTLQIPPIVILRYEGYKRTIQRMYAELNGQLLARYWLTQVAGKPDIVEVPFSMEVYLRYMREYYTPTSQKAIQPPFVVNNEASMLSEQDVKTRVWKNMQEMLEKQYWERVYPDVNKIEIPDIPVAQMSLKQLCKKKLSWVDTVYGDWNGLKRTVHSRENLTAQKTMKLYSEFCVETAERTPTDLYVFDLVPGALYRLINAMGSRSNYETLILDLDFKRLFSMVSMHTSGGINPGDKYVVDVKGTKIEVTSVGKKCHMAEQAIRRLWRICKDIKEDPTMMVAAIWCVIKIKDEFRFGQYKTEAELKAMALKTREFFIPDLTHIYMSIMINQKRMLLERNNVIRIGMRWWYGGAEYLYKYLNGDMPNMIWVDGDIEGLDKHISDWLLMLYCAGVQPYYRKEGMSQTDMDFLENLMIYWATNVCAKLVCHVGSFWRYMNGQMYSGGKETSHGDSWIMAFIFYVYCQHIMKQNREFEELIMAFLDETFIAIVVYGDDHIWCVPDVLQRVMNHESWRDFLKLYFRMNLRDAHTYTSLLSVPDDTGRLRVRGPRFLKRHFIRGNDPELAQILPYKEIDESACRMFTTSFDTPGEMVAVTIGFAWDSMFTNIYMYQLSLDAYRMYMRMNPLTPQETLIMMERLATTNPRVRRLLRKSGVSKEEFYSFPTAEALRRRHVLDPEKANYIVRAQDLDKIGTIFEFEEWDWSRFE
jgi:hypothetical protein